MNGNDGPVRGRSSGAGNTGDSSARIDAYIAALPDSQRDAVARLRALIHEADPGISEDWKWGTPVFSHGGLVCAIGAFKDHLKVNFFKGASLADPHRLFNAGLDAKAMRSIDIRPGDSIDEAGLRELVRTAVAGNRSRRAASPASGGQTRRVAQ